MLLGGESNLIRESSQRESGILPRSRQVELQCHEEAVWTGLIIGERAAPNETATGVETLSRFESGPGAGFQAQPMPLPAAGHPHQVRNHGGADALAPRRRPGVHGLELTMARLPINTSQRPYRQQLMVTAETEERHGRVHQLLDIKGMDIFRRSLAMHELQVRRQQLPDVLGAGVVGSDQSVGHRLTLTRARFQTPGRP